MTSIQDFRGSQHLCLLSSHGQNPLANWTIPSRNSTPTRFYDKYIKSYCLLLSASSKLLCQLSGITASKKGTPHNLIVFQIFMPPSSSKFSIELTVSTKEQSLRKNMYFSTATKTIHITPLHACVPVDGFPKNDWISLIIDLQAYVSLLYKNTEFQFLHQVAVQGDKVRLRNIFTLQNQKLSNSDLNNAIPKGWEFSHAAWAVLDGGVLRILDSNQKVEPEIEIEVEKSDKEELKSSSSENDSLELLYDDVLKCFFDPTTGKYYNLR